ncbi:MAG TPA: response regulator [Gemmataceae bacterium]|nr:response regulator [Gemmataceae bacterium]
MSLRYRIAILVAAFTGASAFGDPPPLTLAQQVRNLSPEQAARKRPARLTGVVTYANAAVGDFFVQDSSAGIYVHPSKHGLDLKPGDLVAVEGVSDAGDFAPCVTPSGVKVVGKGKLPDPLPYSLLTDDSRWLDGQWVQAWVVVRSVSVSAAGGFTEAEVFSANGTATVCLPGEEFAAAFEKMVGRNLLIRGVCVPRFKDRIVVGPPRLYVQHLPLTPLVAPSAAQAEPPPDAPPRMIEHLLSFTPSPHVGNRRVKIGGTVTANPFPGVVFVQDATAGAVVFAESNERIALHSRVEASGLLRIEGRRISLAGATVRVFGPTDPVTPANTPAAPLFGGERDGVLVRVEGRVENVQVTGGWTELTLADHGRRFEVFVPGAVAVAPGVRLAAVGVATVHQPHGKVSNGFGLVSRDERDVTVLELPPPQPPPPYWTVGRVRGVLVGIGGVLVLCGVWLVTLRAQVRRNTEQIRKQFDDQARLAGQLRQAAKLEAVGRLAGGIAHDFNNLLTVINGCSELLAEVGRLDDERAAALVADIRTAGNKAAALTGQLLTFSRKTEVTLTAVDLNAAVRESAQLLRRVIGDDIHVVTRLGPDLPAVRAEPGLLHQVILNLAVNAKDAMPGGGTLTLQTSLVVSNEVGDVVAPTDPPSDTRPAVRLTVSDTGCGMDAQTQARLFEPFFTTKELGKGTGLGLATVYGIVQTVRGKIRIHSEVGKGSTFHIDLRPHGDPPSDSVNRSGGAAVRLDGIVVLLVEDNDMVREMLVQGLTDDGATVLPAANADAALRLIAADTRPIDVLLTDVMMPGMNGRQLAERVQAARPGVKVVFMSGYAPDDVLRQGVLDNQVAFLQKPFTPDQLTARLHQILTASAATATATARVTTLN